MGKGDAKGREGRRRPDGLVPSPAGGAVPSFHFPLPAAFGTELERKSSARLPALGHEGPLLISSPLHVCGRARARALSGSLADKKQRLYGQHVPASIARPSRHPNLRTDRRWMSGGEHQARNGTAL